MGGRLFPPLLVRIHLSGPKIDRSSARTLLQGISSLSDKRLQDEIVGCAQGPAPEACLSVFRGNTGCPRLFW